MTTVESPTTTRTWTPGGWRRLPAAHQPPWPDPTALAQAAEELNRSPELVAPQQIMSLRRQLAFVAHGRGFLLQGGDCAETFDESTAAAVEQRVELFRVLGRMISDRAGLPVVPVGRMAGQFAKPRSSQTETVDGTTLHSYFGHLVNDPAPDAGSRIPDPRRLLRGYRHAARTIGLLAESRRKAVAAHAGPDGSASALWTSHEALILDYEEPFARFDPETDDWFLTSTHLPWIGERTRQPDGAHVEFLSGVANPIGCKIGPSATVDEVRELCARLDPRRQPGRLVLIARMGPAQVARRLPGLVRAVALAGHPAIWICDPMHANTFSAAGRKTRSVDDICCEIEGFVTAVRSAGGWPGGLHLECTHEMVTECLGGSAALTATDLAGNYTTACDPRLNHDQTLDVVRFAADLLA
ncbi:3-deoxy-7-phosphoheptulonate synthase [Nocardia tengchongensis]|uniref:3-deoxy-7-phosphoheptulonate synthase n=1 Tax=Nocardia tengchongensis TaxID=2055889 RepID=UPI0036A44496